jgi:hypothetical protein
MHRQQMKSRFEAHFMEMLPTQSPKVGFLLGIAQKGLNPQKRAKVRGFFS